MVFAAVTARRRSMALIALTIPILGHASVIGLTIFNRQGYVTLQGTPWGALANNPLWAVWHAVALISLIVAHTPRWTEWALALSASCLTVWGSLNLIAALSAPHPVGLLGPTLALVIGVGVAVLSAQVGS